MPLKEMIAAIITGGAVLIIGVLIQEYVFYACSKKKKGAQTTHER